MSWTSKHTCSWHDKLKHTAHLNILVHDMINLLYYEYWTDKQKYLYETLLKKFNSDMHFEKGFRKVI